MANRKTYEIVINGVQQATENVTSLGEALNKLGNTTVQGAAKGLDDLGKAEQKLAQFDSEYQKALAATKAELKEKNKAVKDSIDLENAEQTVMTNSRETYAEKQRLLTALGKVIRNMTTDTEADIQKQNELKNQYASLNQELKDFDAEMGNHQRNVGDYRGALKESRQEMKELEGQMVALLQNGVSKNDEAFVELAKKAGELKDAIADASEEVNRFASDTKKLDDVVNVAQSATAAFELYKGTMSMFGIETEGAEEAIQKLMGAMSVIQSLQTLSETLQNGSATAKLFQLALKGSGAELLINQVNAIKATAAQTGMTVAQKAGAVASKTLGLALKAIPLMLVISLVATLITHWKDIVKWFKDTFPIIGQLSNKFGGLQGVIKGLGAAVVNWLVNPFKTFANVIGKILKGDFQGAWKAALDGVKNQFSGTLKAFTTAATKVAADRKKAAEQTVKNNENTNKKILSNTKAHNKAVTDDLKDRLKEEERLREEAARKEKERLEELKRQNEELHKLRLSNTELFVKSELLDIDAQKRLLENLLKETKIFEEQKGIIEDLRDVELERIQIQKDADEKKILDEVNQRYGNIFETVDDLKAEIQGTTDLTTGFSQTELEYFNQAALKMEILAKQARNNIDKINDDTRKRVEGITPKAQAPKAKGRYSDAEGNTDFDKLFGGDFAEITERMASTLSNNVLNPIADAFSMMLDFALEEAEEKLEEAEEMHDRSVEMVERSQERLSELNDKIRESSGVQLEAYKQQQAEEMMLLAQREAEERRLAKEKERREKEVEKKQRQQRKMELGRSRIEAIINTAVSATKAYKDYGWPLGAVFAAILTAMGMAQVATITKQMSKYADGGLLLGPSHSQGGIKVGNTGIEVEGGEAIINKRSTARYLPLLDAINAAGNGGKHTIKQSSGRFFADGGQLNFERIDSNLSQIDSSRAIQRTIESIDMHPVVEVVQIAKGLNNLSSVRDLAGGNRLLRQ